VPAKLSIDFGFAYGEYSIVEVRDDYEYEAVGHSTRRLLVDLEPRRALTEEHARRRAGGREKRAFSRRSAQLYRAMSGLRAARLEVARAHA